MNDKYTEALLLEGRISNLIGELELFEESYPSLYAEQNGRYELSQAIAFLKEAYKNMNIVLKKII